MSRIGKQPVVITKGVKIAVSGNTVNAEGPKGKLSMTLPGGVKAEVQEDKVVVSRLNDEKQNKSMHGTARALISNMIQGVSEGFKKELEIVGVGYKAQMKGKDLVLSIGFSHPVEFKVPEGLKVTASKPTRIEIEGIDKQLLGQFAADIRRVYPPEPYKGKGIRYAGEEVRKKLGKALAK